MENSRPLVRFLAFALILYVAWYLLYDLLLKPAGTLDRIVIQNTVWFSRHILELSGYNVFTDNQRYLGLTPEGIVEIGPACNGVILFALFSIFIIAFPGPSLKKLYYIPAGIIIIHALNILRVTALVLIQHYNPKALAFNHTYTFTVIIYGCIFFLWIFWVKRFSPIFQKAA